MSPVGAEAIRASFVNCSRGEARRAALPDLDRVRWHDLDFLGWPDPSGSDRAYVVVPRGDGHVGLLLRRSAARGAARATMCQVCITAHTGDGVALTVARRTGPAGRKADSTGIYLCRDLACSLYVRGTRVPGGASVRETLSVEASVERLRRNLDRFIDRVLA